MGLVLKHSDFLPDGEMVHFTRTDLNRSRPDPLHSHDFFEVFWVQNGSVRHHLEGSVEQLSEGDLRLIPPGPAHGLQAKGNDALVVSISVHPDTFDRLEERHSSELQDLRKIQGHSFGSLDLARLNQAALRLERSNRGSLATEGFLLPLLNDLSDAESPHDMPKWLADAMLRAQSPEVFRDGASGLVDLTGRAHAHVSRSMRKFAGQSPSEFINDVRMRYAARQLVTDSEAIPEIAAACGIPNLSHFHKVFRAHHGTTPHKYRQKFQRDVVQPG